MDRPPHTYTTRNENIPASFGLLSAIKRIPAAQPRTKRATRPKQDRNLSARIGDGAAPLRSEKSHWRYFIAIIVIEISAFQLFVQRLPLTRRARMCTIDRSPPLLIVIPDDASPPAEVFVGDERLPRFH